MSLIIMVKAALNKGSLFLQIKYSIILSFLISPFTWLIEKLSTWHLFESDYVAFVVGAIIVDHLLGTAYHLFWKRDFSIAKNASGFITKLLIVVSVGYLFEGLNTLMAQESILKDYTVMVLRLMVFLYPAGSAFANSYEMTGKKFPPMGFMEKLKQFSESTSINNNNAKDI